MHFEKSFSLGSLETLDALDEYEEMIESGDGQREVLLGHVELLDVARDLFDHLLGLLRLHLDVLDLREQMHDGLLRVLERHASALGRVRLVVYDRLDFVIDLSTTSEREERGQKRCCSTQQQKQQKEEANFDLIC